jgi:hypothetical protein
MWKDLGRLVSIDISDSLEARLSGILMDMAVLTQRLLCMLMKCIVGMSGEDGRRWQGTFIGRRTAARLELVFGYSFLP